MLEEIRKRAAEGSRVLVTTLTKKMAEDLTDCLLEMGVRAGISIPRSTPSSGCDPHELRLGEFDVLVGINLLREASTSQVSLVAILDMTRRVLALRTS